MKACVFDGSHVRIDAVYPDPVPPPGEVAVRVGLAGVCRTDLEIVRGYMGFRGVLGHEFVGTALGGRYAGRRVVGGINCVCGECDLCRAGLPTHCRRRTVLGIAGRDGAFAEILTLPEANLVAVPDSVPDRAAVFAELLAAAIQVGRQVVLSPSQKIIILGDGRLAQLVARVFRAWGLSPTVVGKHAEKLALLAPLGIATVMVAEAQPGDSSDMRARDAGAPGMSHKTADVVVECTGTAGGLAMAMRLVRPRGTIVLKSTVANTAGMDLAPLVVDEITVVGSRCGPMADAVAMLAAGQVDVESLITAEYPLDRAADALEGAARPEAIKVLVRP